MRSQVRRRAARLAHSVNHESSASRRRQASISRAGWDWRQQRKAERPVYWQAKRVGVWSVRRYRAIEGLAPHAPVVFVSSFEADAWCRWAGRRLPSEAEWEAAAIGVPTADGARLVDAKRR